MSVDAGTLDLDALIRGPGPRRSSLVLPDRSDDDEQEKEKDDSPPVEPAPAPADDEEDEDAKRLRAIERRLARSGSGGGRHIIPADSSSESSSPWSTSLV